MNRNKNLIIILLVINIILLISLVGAVAYILMNVNNGTDENIVINNNSNNTNEVIDNGENEEGNEDEEDEVEENPAIKTFNAIFESYEGTELSSAQIKALLSQIEINNTNEEHQVTLNEEGITKMEQVEDNKKYNVELSYDDNGYVDVIKIIDTSATPVEDENNQNISTDMDKIIFNTKFTSYIGDNTGEKLNSLLMTIQNSNETNPEHQITLSSNNLSGLNEILATDIYTITLSYDTNGYVSNINIDKKIQ